MQSASTEYKRSMKEDLREPSEVKIYLGVINKDAQQNAFTDSQYTDYSNKDLIFGSPVFEAYYATAEEKQGKADGSMYFMPHDSSLYALYQGAVSNTLLGSARFDFTDFHALNIKGLSVDFGDYYPTDFNIVTNSEVYEVRNNAESYYVTENVFENVDELTIVPLAMVGGQQRMRILSILFGVGLIFTNDIIKSTSRKEKVSHIAENLPTVEFSFVINNQNQRFSKDNPNSFANFLEVGQVCEYSYIRNLLNGGNEVINGGIGYLKSASSTKDTASFSTNGVIANISTEYYKGKYYENGISLYDLAENVFLDAGIENYVLDPYLKTVITKNPLPKEKHMNCIQLIANAGRCVMHETRTGAIELKSSFVPDVTGIVGTHEHDYSKVENVLNDTKVNRYADATSQYARVDNSMLFLPRNAEYLECGYVSSCISDENGLFTVNPTVTIDFESQWKMFGINILFGGSIPKEIKIHQYNNGSVVATSIFTELEENMHITSEFAEMDKMVIEFTKAYKYQRARIDKIVFGDVTDYIVEKNDMSALPTATNTDKVAEIDTSIYTYNKGTELKELTTVTCEIGDNTIFFSNPSHDFSVSFYTGTEEEPVIIGSDWVVSIVDSGAYFVTLNCNVQADVVISGYEFTVTESVYKKTINESGIVKKSVNTLVSSLNIAKDLSDWLAEYYANDINISVSMRGEPRIDCDDLMYMESDYVKNNLIRAESYQLDTAVGMSRTCKLIARRVSYVANT